MSQSQILNHLKKNGPSTAHQIADSIDVRYNSVTESLRRMVKFNELKFDWIKNPKTGRPVKQFKLTENHQKVHVL